MKKCLPIGKLHKDRHPQRETRRGSFLHPEKLGRYHIVFDLSMMVGVFC